MNRDSQAVLPRLPVARVIPHRRCAQRNGRRGLTKDEAVSLFIDQGFFLIHWKSVVVEIVERPKGVYDSVALDGEPVHRAVVDVLDGLFAAGPQQPDAWHPPIVSAR